MQVKGKQKILFLSTLTPPFYGSSMSNEMCLQILNDDEHFIVKNIKLNYSVRMADLGKFNLRKITGFFTVLSQIRKYLKEFKPEIIYFVPAVTGVALIRDFLFLEVVKKLKRSKLIIHLRGQFKKEDLQNPFQRFLIKSILKSDRVIVLGTELIENLKNKVVPERIKILPNAIHPSITDVEFESIIRKRQNNTLLNILFLSNLQQSKGWFKLLQTCKLIKESEIEFICHFVGDWHSRHEEKKFFKYVEENYLSNNIIYHGRLIGKEKKKILEMSDMLIFPTEYEAFGRVIIEAMEFGLPVIANGTGSIPSIIREGETGYVLKENSPREIFKKILELLAPEIRNKMGIAARERFLNKFSVDVFKKEFIKLFDL